MLGVLSIALGSVSHAADTTVCGQQLTYALRHCERVIGSLRPYKSGELRVFASDGSEFTVAQAQWMKQQLALVAQACVDGQVADAERRLGQVQQMLGSHHHSR
jgi:hypothetical protein